LHKKLVFLLISGQFLLIFYQIFLAYSTQTLQTNPATPIFRPETAIAPKITPKLSPKNPIFKKIYKGKNAGECAI